MSNLVKQIIYEIDIFLVKQPFIWYITKLC